uniref:Protein kinase domain-containing protein n=1 Tax=Alexandrium monilatum TaxID=311494 RepID=A0A7S4Q1A0_9DINO|mmetsp:Transcript_17288/g.52024  ORF Transcript_17288/g.52024 Transcript_17288/m.52024 type:complete len:598 (-) Transcript_17288:134-1927(-)
MQRLREPGSLVRSYHQGDRDRNLWKAYEVDPEPLGEGRYSRVFGATHRSTGARRAIKTADRQGPWTQYRDLGMECPGLLACHEADILRRLDHPNVIRILEVFEEQKSVHLVLELCEGGDVLERILVSNGRLPEKDIARLFIQMLFAVWHLHQNGVVHRDLKPEHFLFTRREPDIEPRPPAEATMKLIDFGLSHKIGVGFAPEGGTPQFMSPEAKTGKLTKESADRGDMWSLGVVLHAMLVGHYPSPHLTDEKHGQYFSRPAWSGVSPPGIELIGLLLRRQPADRPSAAAALKHPWAQTAINANVIPPEPLLRCVAPAIKSYGAANSLRRLALAAVAREADDRDLSGLRQLLQKLELSCDGRLARSALLRANGADGVQGALGETAMALFRSFDAIVEKGGLDALTWTELVALFMCAGVPSSKGATCAHTPLIRDEACFRAFDLLSYGTGSVSASSLDQLILRPKGAGDAGDQSPMRAVDKTSSMDLAKLNRLVQEGGSSGTICYTDFLRLARGERRGPVAGASLLSLFACGRSPASAPAPASARRASPPPISPPPSPTSPRAAQSPRSTPTSERGSPPSSPGKKKKRRPLSILGMTSL